MTWPMPFALDDLRAQLEAREPTLAAEKISAALALLALPTDRTNTQSESLPYASAEQAIASLEAWEELAPVIEPLMLTESPSYAYTWHPLPALVISSHFLWHWWELRAAAPLIERVTEFAYRAMTPSNSGIIARRPMETATFQSAGSPKSFYLDGTILSAGWYYLAEIAEAEGRSEAALEWFERFLRHEPSFAPLADYLLAEEFFYYKHDPPNTVEACRRGGILAEALGKRGRARALYDYGISLSPTRFSPRRERAAMLRREGSEELALADECAYLDGLLAYERTREHFNLFESYLDLAQRSADAGAHGLSEQARMRALDALRRTRNHHEMSLPGIPCIVEFRPSTHETERMLAEVQAAEARGDDALAEAYCRALFDAGVGLALVGFGRGERRGLALVEAELDRLSSAKSWPALESCCDALDTVLERAAAMQSAYPSLSISKLPLAEELAASLALYREVIPTAASPQPEPG